MLLGIPSVTLEPKFPDSKQKEGAPRVVFILCLKGASSIGFNPAFKVRGKGGTEGLEAAGRIPKIFGSLTVLRT